MRERLQEFIVSLHHTEIKVCIKKFLFANIFKFNYQFTAMNNG